MNGIILSGGRGTRLGINTPKSLIQINGCPILEYLLYFMRCAGVKDITCISDREKPVRGWLEDHEPTVRIVDQEEPIGTGQAVHLALGNLVLKTPLMVMLGDIVPTDFVIADIIRYRPNHSILGVYESETPEEGAVVETDGKNWLVSVEEKPENPKGNRILSGIFYFQSAQQFFNSQQWLLNKQRTLKGEYDIIDTINLMNDREISVPYERFRCIDSHVFDCGTFERIKKAEAYFENHANG